MSSRRIDSDLLVLLPTCEVMGYGELQEVWFVMACDCIGSEVFVW
jgi:hypothetical protein